MKHNLNKDFGYYLSHQKELVGQYGGKVLVIRDQKVVGAYESEMKALEAAEKDYEIGTFLIQRCDAGDDSFTQTYHSRVAFA